MIWESHSFNEAAKEVEERDVQDEEPAMGRRTMMQQ
jgi:hypothetical protein